MKDPAFRDNLLTLIGLSAVASVYLLLIFLPGQRHAARVKAEIAEAEQGIQDVPLRVAELEALQRDIERRVARLDETRSLVPNESDEHAVVACVDELARRERLRVVRLEPLAPVRFESYEARPFRLSVEGDFRGLLAFIRGLELQERLFTIDSIVVARESGGDGKPPQVDVNFSVYAGWAAPAGSAEDSRSSVRAGDDRQQG